MTRYILALFIIVMVSRAAQAGCYDNLSQGRDSNYYQISSNALTTESSLVEKTAREALKTIYSKTILGFALDTISPRDRFDAEKGIYATILSFLVCIIPTTSSMVPEPPMPTFWTTKQP